MSKQYSPLEVIGTLAQSIKDVLNQHVSTSKTQGALLFGQEPTHADAAEHHASLAVAHFHNENEELSKTHRELALRHGQEAGLEMGPIFDYLYGQYDGLLMPDLPFLPHGMDRRLVKAETPEPVVAEVPVDEAPAILSPIENVNLELLKHQLGITTPILKSVPGIASPGVKLPQAPKPPSIATPRAPKAPPPPRPTLPTPTSVATTEKIEEGDEDEDEKKKKDKKKKRDLDAKLDGKGKPEGDGACSAVLHKEGHK